MSNESFVRNKLNMFSLFRHCRKDELSFNIVAETGKNVEATFDFVECDKSNDSIDNVASTLLLMWTGLKSFADGPDLFCC